MKATDRDIRDLAEAVWLIATDKPGNGAEHNGVNGKTIVGTCNALTREAAKQIGKGALVSDKWVRTSVRQYLHDTGNVVTLAQVPGTKTYRMFVAATWRDGAIVHLPIGGRRGPRLTDHDLGLDREEEPVTTTSFKPDLDAPLTEYAWALLTGLQSAGGTVRDPNGHATYTLAERAGVAHLVKGGSVSGTLKLLDDHGLIEREKVSAKRVSFIKLTPAGKHVVLNGTEYRSGTAVVSEYLARVGRVEGSALTQRIAEALGIETYKVSSALVSLRGAGFIHTRKTSENGVFDLVSWLGVSGDEDGLVLRYIPVHLYRDKRPAEAPAPAEGASAVGAETPEVKASPTHIEAPAGDEDTEPPVERINFHLQQALTAIQTLSVSGGSDAVIDAIRADLSKVERGEDSPLVFVFNVKKRLEEAQ